MIRSILICLLLLGAITNVSAQKFISDKSNIGFFSEAPIENIKAENDLATSIFDVGTGEIVFGVPIKGFTFRKSLMQKHFNENYLESDKHPKATFSGKMTKFDLSGTKQVATAIGALTIHGKTRDVTITGNLQKKGDKVIIEAVFPVKLKDHNIKIPKLLFSNIAEIVEVTVRFEYKPYDSTSTSN